MFNANAVIIGGSKVGEAGGEFVFSSQYEAIQTYANANTIPLPTEAGQQVDDLLIKDLVSVDYWDKIDAIWQMTTEGVSAYALLNQKNPGSNIATLHGTVVPSYVAKEGFHGNAAQSAYIDFHWNPSVNGVNFLQDNASIHIYTIDNTQHTSPLLGCANASAVGRLFLTNRDESDMVEVNMNSVGSVTGGIGGPGLISGVRTASNSQSAHRNGAQQATDIDVSSTLSTFDLVGFAIRTNTGVQLFHDGHLGLVIVGSSAIVPSVLDAIWDAHLVRIAAL